MLALKILIFMVFCMFIIGTAVMLYKAITDFIPSFSNEARNRVKKIKHLAIIRDEAQSMIESELENCSNWEKYKLRKIGG